MKKLLFACFLVPMLLLSGCSHDSYQYSEKLETALVGLTKLTLTPREENAMMSLISDSTHLKFPVYSLQGELLTQAHIREKQTNVTLDCYGESISNVKAVVLRDLTQTELDDFWKNWEENEKLKKQAMEDLKGKPAPVFTARDVNGNLVDLTALKGKVVVLNFWFIHCFACVQEMPELNQAVHEFKDNGVVFVGLTFDKEADTKAFLQHTEFYYNIIAEAQHIFDVYGIKPCPTNIVIDKNGQIVFAESGYNPQENGSQKKLTKAIEKTLGK